MIMALQKLYLKLLSLALLSNHTKNKETGYNLGTNDSFDYIMELQCIIQKELIMKLQLIYLTQLYCIVLICLQNIELHVNKVNSHTLTLLHFDLFCHMCMDFCIRIHFIDKYNYEYQQRKRKWQCGNQYPELNSWIMRYVPVSFSEVRLSPQ